MIEIKSTTGKILKTVNADTLERADFRGANFEGANLRGANLRGADFRGAYLQGADIEHCKGIMSFALGKHLGFVYFYKEKRICVGCIDEPASWWLNNWKEKAINHYYNEYAEVYGGIIECLAMSKLPGIDLTKEEQ